MERQLRHAKIEKQNHSLAAVKRHDQTTTETVDIFINHRETGTYSQSM
jgi:hypothetical protein